MIRIVWLTFPVLFFFACNPPKNDEMLKPENHYTFFVGTYTDSSSQGIHLLEFSPEAQKFKAELLYEGINNPSFLLLNRAENLLISLEEEANVNGGNLRVFGLDGSTLTPLDTIPSYGDHPCYIGISPNEKFVVVANYTGGSLSIFKLSTSGKLSHLQTIQHEGNSIHENRQEKAHVHSSIFSPNGDFLVVADLGTDKIYTYAFDQFIDEPANLHAIFETNPGDGPRHVLFSADGKTLFAVNELTAVLEIFDFEDGKLTSRQRLSLLEDDFSGAVGAAEVRISSDEKFIYVSNRGEANTISVFEKTKNSREFKRIQVIDSGGTTPRNFNLTPDGKYLICANQGSNNIVVFERDSRSGMLKPTDWKVQVNKPVYLFPLKN